MRAHSLYLLLFVVATGCTESRSAASVPQASRGQPGPGGPGGPNAGPPPALVELATAEDGTLTDGWSYLGRVEPAKAADLAAAVAGPVVSVNVSEGDRVAAGQTLIAVDSALIRAELAAAQAREQGLVAEADVSARQFERIKDVKYPTLSDLERERFERAATTAKSQLDTQRADVRRLEVQLARHTIKAPFAGIITARRVDPGAWVSVGQAVLGLVSLNELEVHVDVSAELGQHIAVGQNAKVLGRTAIQAQIAGIVGALQSDTRTMRVRLVPTERPDWLLPGMAVDVEFSVTVGGQAEGSVLVPRDAVIRGPVRSRVMKLEDGKAKAISVDVLATADERALVRGEGLGAGDKVIVRGNERLRPDQPVRTAE